MASVKSSPINGFQRHFLVTILLLLLITMVIFINPFIIDLLFAGIIVTAVFPIHKWVIKKIYFSRSLASFVSMILIMVIIILPFTLFGFFVAEQAGDAYVVVSDRVNLIIEHSSQADNPSKIIRLLPFGEKIEGVLEYLPFSTNDLLKTGGDLVGNISSFLLAKTTNILKSLSLLLVHTIVFLMSLFFFLREGDRLVAYIRSLVPLSKKYREELFQKLGKLSYGIIYGIFGAAILQGLLVGIGFAVAGINNPAFWGSIAALFSPVPYIGTSLVWVPAVAAIALGGDYLAASLLFAWCAFIVGAADNVIKPFLIGSSTQLNPMALLLVLLGGTFAFGIKGLIFGPFVLTLTLSFLHIYQLEYKSVLEVDDETVLVARAPRKKKPVKAKKA